MEQSLSQLLTKAMTALGQARVKYPSLSSENSALLFINRYLKAYNPGNTPYMAKKHKKSLTSSSATAAQSKHYRDTTKITSKRHIQKLWTSVVVMIHFTTLTAAKFEKSCRS